MINSGIINTVTASGLFFPYKLIQYIIHLSPTSRDLLMWV